MDFRVVLAVSAALFVSCPPSFSQCADLHKYQADLHQAQKNVVRGSSGIGAIERRRIMPIDIPDHPDHVATSDASAPPRDFLSSPITNVDDMRAAGDQASQLERQGQPGLAKKIRGLIDQAEKELLGANVPTHALECISVADGMRQVAWQLQENHPQDAIVMAQKAVRVYRKELGDNPKTAAALIDLARIYDRTGSMDNAKRSYLQAFDIYAKKPNWIDVDLATGCESYADFLERTTKRGSQSYYQRASAVRKKLRQSQRKANSAWSNETKTPQKALLYGGYGTLGPKSAPAGAKRTKPD